MIPEARPPLYSPASPNSGGGRVLIARTVDVMVLGQRGGGKHSMNGTIVCSHVMFGGIQ